MAESRNILVIAPHPDDESIGCGGTLCRHTARGDRVVAVFLTSGELGLEHLPREEAWRVREGEAEAAAEVLGLADLIFLRCPDWFVGEGVDEAAALLRPILTRGPAVHLPAARPRVASGPSGGPRRRPGGPPRQRHPSAGFTDLRSLDTAVRI